MRNRVYKSEDKAFHCNEVAGTATQADMDLNIFTALGIALDKPMTPEQIAKVRVDIDERAKVCTWCPKSVLAVWGEEGV